MANRKLAAFIRRQVIQPVSALHDNFIGASVGCSACAGNSINGVFSASQARMITDRLDQLGWQWRMDGKPGTEGEHTITLTDIPDWQGAA